MGFVRYITITSKEGITLYHHSFLNIEFDEILFSGFTGAIIAFTKELGDELFSINMKEQEFHFRSLSEGIVILSIQPGFSKSSINAKLDILEKSPHLSQIFQFGMIPNTPNNDFNKQILQLFDVPSLIDQINNE